MDRTAAWFDAGPLVGVLEDLGPDAALVMGIVDGGSVAKPHGYLLFKWINRHIEHH